MKHLAKSTRPLVGPGDNVLPVLGVAKETLRSGNRTERAAVEYFQIVRRVDSITIESVKQQYVKPCRS